MAPEFVPLKQISMKSHPEFNEVWLHERLSDQPELLGLGDLVLLDHEKSLPGGGRLDLLLMDSDTRTRYEVEIQLGATDASHIIRTLEYWDIERKRYPQYEHIAVIAAEEMTSRFFNVIGLFNGFIPIIAIQVKALDLGSNQVSLDFTTVMSHAILAREQDDPSIATDRPYWEDKASPNTLRITDYLFDITREVDPDVSLNYNKFYIGLSKGGKASNFVTFVSQKSQVKLRAKWLESEDVQDLVEDFENSSITLHSNANQKGCRLLISKVPSGEERRLLHDAIERARKGFEN